LEEQYKCLCREYQVWYLDILRVKNNYEAADNGGSAGHKEINRTTLTKKDIVQGLKQMLYKTA
jgi:sucrose phosphorylase